MPVRSALILRLYAAAGAKVAKLREAYDAGERPVAADAKRILITGCPVGGVINKIGRTIESNGGVVVCMDDCSGERTAAMMIDPEAPDILRAIADATWISTVRS